MRGPDTISETTSPADLPKKGELRVEDEIRPAEEALADLDRRSTSTRPESRIADKIAHACAARPSRQRRAR